MSLTIPSIPRQLTNFLIVGLMSGSICGLAVFADGTPPESFPRPDYILQPSDLLHVQVYQEDDLMRDVRISQEHTVMLPLIGSVDLKGKTPREAEIIIRDLYNKDYLVNPQVTVSVLEYAKTSVDVLGSVNTPGSIEFLPEQPMNLLDAIARAGGFNRLADRKHVTLTRSGDDGKQEKTTINTDELIQGSAKQAWPLIKGDVIFVPEKLL
jgi:polysaccharide export outer membrane protein